MDVVGAGAVVGGGLVVLGADATFGTPLFDADVATPKPMNPVIGEN